MLATLRTSAIQDCLESPRRTLLNSLGAENLWKWICIPEDINSACTQISEISWHALVPGFWRSYLWHVPLLGWAVQISCAEISALSTLVGDSPYWYIFFPIVWLWPHSLDWGGGLYYSLMQLAEPVWEQLSALFKAAIQYGQSKSVLSKTLGLICRLYFTFPIMWMTENKEWP